MRLLPLAVLVALAGCSGGDGSDASVGDLLAAPDLNPCGSHCCDKVKDGDESDRDCGGSCAGCQANGMCRGPADCASMVCSGGHCADPGCSDGAKNGDESDVDCGGSCPACPDGKMCNSALDCMSQYCGAGRCAVPPCGDGMKDGLETDVDCGGNCAPCADGKGCVHPSDCRSGICTGMKCAQSCPDGVTDGNESDVDCGGPDCPACALGGACAKNDDCDQSAGPVTCWSPVNDPKVPCSSPLPGTCVVGCRGPGDCGGDCCDPLGLVCGKPWVCEFASNCGTQGQFCFHCIDSGPQFEACVPSAAGDYCAPQCGMGCAGCCQTRQGTIGMGSFCVHGDDDAACGAAGGGCVACGPGSRCVSHACVPLPDGGPLDGATD